jgi:hypothetical protein
MMAVCTGCIQSDEIAFTDFNDDLLCITPYEHTITDEFVIRSQEEYTMLTQYLSTVPNCTDFTLSPIDFSEKTLLGMYTTGTGCTIEFERHVYRDDDAKTITYVITVIEEGNCEMLGMSMNWITIPTVPQEYAVVFDVKKE